MAEDRRPIRRGDVVRHAQRPNKDTGIVVESSRDLITVRWPWGTQTTARREKFRKAK